MLIDVFVVCELITCFCLYALLFCFIYMISSGPASYNNEEKTSFSYVLDHQPLSRRGYSFNARTEKRKVFVPKVIETERVLFGSHAHDFLIVINFVPHSLLFHSNRLTYQVRIRIKWI